MGAALPVVSLNFKRSTRFARNVFDKFFGGVSDAFGGSLAIRMLRCDAKPMTQVCSLTIVFRSGEIACAIGGTLLTLDEEGNADRRKSDRKDKLIFKVIDDKMAVAQRLSLSKSMHHKTGAVREYPALHLFFCVWLFAPNATRAEW